MPSSPRCSPSDSASKGEDPVPNEVELVNRVLRQIAPGQEINTLDADALLQDQIDLDSMDFLQLVTGIGEEARIDIPERDYPYLATLNSTYAYVRSRISG
jgi:acyl carrier protein